MTNEEMLNAVRSAYAKATAPKAASGKKLSNEDRLKRYFNTFLGKNETSGQKRIRLLPFKEGENPFTPIRFHEMLIDDNWVKLYDPSQEGERSPLNEIGRELYDSPVEADKEAAKAYFSNPFYIFRVIDRDNEEDGVKFWRFRHNRKKDGICDKIYPLFDSRGMINDAEQGRDLTLYLEKVTGNNGKPYTKVQSVLPEDISPLSDDPKKVEEWINDDQTWEDVYSKRPLSYLEIVAKGEVPKWSSEKNDYISMSEGEADLTPKDDKASAESTKAESVKAPETVDKQAEAEADGDLPF